MYPITIDGVSMWCVNGINFLTKEEAEKAEQEILDFYRNNKYCGD